MEPVGSPPTTPEPRARPAPELRPPSGAPGQASGPGWSLRASLMLLAAAIGLAVAAVLLLPTWIAPQPRPDVPSTASPAAPVPSVAKPAEPPPVEARRVAEEALQAYLKRRAELELLNAPAWAAAEMASAAGEVTAGDRYFGQRQFAEAGSRYATAGQRLEALAASRPQRLAEALQAGWQALEDDDAELATRQFAQALRIEPGLEEAVHGHARAEARPGVLERMTEGRRAELAGQLEAAEEAYRAAVSLDAEYTPAAAAATRVAAQRADHAFGRTMSDALAALDAGRTAEARRALAAAAQLRPGDRAVTDARRRLATTIRDGELARLRVAADAKVAAEAWGEAAELFRAALKIDPAAGFATSGLARAERLVKLHARIDHYLDDPERLHSPQPLAEAERLLEAAAGEVAEQPRLATRAARLAAEVRAARTPRPVTLRSDGITEVTVYHVGRLGAFAERRLELRPGRYTALGARPGYRDVRVTFTVAADRAPEPVDVRCREPL